MLRGSIEVELGIGDDTGLNIGYCAGYVEVFVRRDDGTVSGVQSWPCEAIRQPPLMCYQHCTHKGLMILTDGLLLCAGMSPMGMGSQLPSGI
jgi:hypothetical protein